MEARHAITSKDLAQALMKAGAVAKTSGISFDELNAIITGIGETSRQTGREIGTSLRFMFRRIQAEKGPKELSKMGIPVLGPTGELRRGMDVLGDLAAKWVELGTAQKLSIAQAIGGRRHYNSLIILMDHWDDALSALEHSINSKGAAERRNLIVMETYAKKLNLSEKKEIYILANEYREKKLRMFTYYLIDELSKGETKLNEVYSQVKQKVKRSSLKKGIGYKQIPQIYGNKKVRVDERYLESLERFPLSPAFT